MHSFTTITTKMGRYRSWLGNHATYIFWLFVLLAILIHCVTISYSPLTWIDEVQIMELARGGIGRKSQNWSMCIIDFNSRDMAWAPYYFGSFLCNLAYKAFGRVGPRLLLLGFLVWFSDIIRRYTLKKSGDSLLSTLLGIMVFCYPALTQSVRGGRVDVIALTFWACAMLLTSMESDKINEFFIAFGIAVFSVMAVFSWITVVMTLPIVMIAYLERLWRQRGEFKRIVISLSGGMIGAFLTAFALLIPFWGRLGEMVSLFTKVSNGNLPESQHNLFIDYLISVSSFPYILILGFICLILRWRSYGYLIGVILFSLVCVQTKVYVFRLLYFLPFALTGIVLFFDGEKRVVLKRFVLGLLAVIAAMEFSWSVLLRNGTELFMQRFRNYGCVLNVLHKEVGMNKCVINDTYQLYYIGIALNWRQYDSGFNPSGLMNKLEDETNMIYICEKQHLTPRLKEELQARGFIEKKVVCDYSNESLNTALHFIKGHGRFYTMGPYCIYERKK